jgi:hypothetical protein
VCVCVCVYVSMFVIMYVCMYMCVCKCEYVCVFVYVCVYVCMYVCLYVCTCESECVCMCSWERLLLQETCIASIQIHFWSVDLIYSPKLSQKYDAETKHEKQVSFVKKFFVLFKFRKII